MDVCDWSSDVCSSDLNWTYIPNTTLELPPRAPVEPTSTADQHRPAALAKQPLTHSRNKPSEMEREKMLSKAAEHRKLLAGSTMSVLADGCLFTTGYEGPEPKHLQ